MDVIRPIFVVSTGRAGSTLLHEVLSHHPDVAWMSRLCERYPGRPARNRRLMRLIDQPLLSRRLKKEFPPKEAWEFWEEYCCGFTMPCRDLLADDVTERARADILKATGHLLTRRRHRLVAKITGWPRIGYLAEIFPDARFVHISRDGRAVVNSMLNVSWWHGWQGPSNWRWGPLSQVHREEWERSGSSFVVLAAIQWKLLMDATEQARVLLDPARLLEVRYEELCAAPADVLARILGFCELRRTASFDRTLAGFAFESTNHRWTTELTARQQEELNDALTGHLVRYGFVPPGETERRA